MDPPHPAAAVEEVLDSGASSDFTFEAGSGGGTDAGEVGSGGGTEAGEAGNGGGDEAGEAGNGGGDEAGAATRPRVTKGRRRRGRG